MNRFDRGTGKKAHKYCLIYHHPHREGRQNWHQCSTREVLHSLGLMLEKIPLMWQMICRNSFDILATNQDSMRLSNNSFLDSVMVIYFVFFANGQLREAMFRRKAEYWLFGRFGQSGSVNMMTANDVVLIEE